MHVVSTAIPDLLIVESPVFTDARGFFTDVFHATRFADAGLPTTFVQDSHSHNAQHVLRGLHYQLHQPQGKLVRAITGTVFDVAVDLRRESATFGHWVGVTLTAGDGRQLYIPPGFAHGFLTLSASADMGYKMTAPYHPASECALAWTDPTVAIAWPLPAGVAPILSPRDHAAPTLDAAPVYA